MPTYTFRCNEGHEWDEQRTLDEESKTSLTPCPVCTDATSGPAGLISGQALPPEHGKKVPSSGVSVHFVGRGWTPPSHFPGRNHK